MDGIRATKKETPSKVDNSGFVFFISRSSFLRNYVHVTFEKEKSSEQVF